MELGHLRSDEPAEPWVGAVVDDRVVGLRAAGEATGITSPSTLTEQSTVVNWREKAELAVESATNAGTATDTDDDGEPAAPVSAPVTIGDTEGVGEQPNECRNRE